MDELEEETQETVFDFAWYLYIGMNKLGFTEKQIGHMTLRKWDMLYDAYKLNFDNEMILTASHKTYADIEKETNVYVDRIDDVIPF